VESGFFLAPKILSKSRFLAGLQCEKRLWLELHDRALAGETDEQTQGLFDQGREAGTLAQGLYPGGVLITEDYLHLPEALRSTEKAVQEGASTLYEAAFSRERVLIRVDILHRVEGTDQWDLIEVKSSAKVKREYLYDLALQKYVLEGAGYQIRKTLLCHLNTQYVREGPLDLGQLFILSDETESVRSIAESLAPLTEKFLKVADSSEAPEISIGSRCDRPHGCPFIDHCWKEVPKDSVFTLINGRELPDTLYQQGIIKISEVPSSLPLSPKQRRQIEAAKTGEPHWNLKAVRRFVEDLEYPLHFLDFEGYNPALPPYDGLRPFQQMPFQFSVHSQEKPDAPWVHHEFLPEGPGDPREALCEKLLQSIGPTGSIVVYYAQYEAGVIRDLALLFPRHQGALQSILDRICDLIGPFKNRDILDPGFLGSASLKAVLPVLVPEMTYEGMEIGEGAAASLAYVKLLDPQVPKAQKEKIRKDLLAYCGQDTWAMVRIFEVLKKKAGV
jgi:hypothetical protein